MHEKDSCQKLQISKVKTEQNQESMKKNNVKNHEYNKIEQNKENVMKNHIKNVKYQNWTKSGKHDEV